MDKDICPGQPKNYLEEEYSFIDELRSELFGLWALGFLVNHDIINDQMARAVEDAMLINMIKNLKATGDKANAIRLRQTYVYADQLRGEIERRTADFPHGRGLIFPRLKREGDYYLRELTYPDSFSDQVKFNLELTR